MQAWGSRQEPYLQKEIARTFAHETFHVGSLLRSLNVPDEVQKRVLEAYWDATPGIEEAAKKVLLNRDSFTRVPTKSVKEENIFPRHVLRDREEALAYAFGEAVDYLRSGLDIDPGKEKHPGSKILLDYMREVLDKKEKQ